MALLCASVSQFHKEQFASSGIYYCVITIDINVETLNKWMCLTNNILGETGYLEWNITPLIQLMPARSLGLADKSGNKDQQVTKDTNYPSCI